MTGPISAQRAALCAILLAVAPCAALAHAGLEPKEASIDAPYKATIRIGHGCEGTATLKVRLRVPDGYVAVTPLAKAGWSLDVVRGAYDRPVAAAGATLTEGVREVVWTGHLPDGQRDEFVVEGTLSGSLKPGTRLYFPVVQECEKGVHRWIEIPAPGKTADDYKEPAPSVKLLAPVN